MPVPRTLSPSSPILRHAGFTLIELVIVVAVTAILGGMSVAFIRNGIAGYVASEQQVTLADMADHALRLIARDVHNALPNSVRVSTNAGNSYLEFVPIISAGRYRSGSRADGSGDALRFDVADSSFDVLGDTQTVTVGSKLVIYNLGIDGADIYEGSNIASLTSVGNGLSNLTFTATTFALSSPSQRFFVVNTASSYVCDMTAGKLWLYPGYTIQSSQPVTLTALSSLATARLVVDGVTACSMQYTPGVLQRSGVVTITLQLSKANAVVRLAHWVNVVNSP